VSYVKKYFASDMKMKLDTGGMAEIKACRGLAQTVMAPFRLEPRLKMVGTWC
jgi:hypothetical protein